MNYLSNAVITQVYPISPDMTYIWVKDVEDRFRPHMGLPWNGELPRDLLGKVVTLTESEGFLHRQEIVDSDGNVYKTCKILGGAERNRRKHHEELCKAMEEGSKIQPLELILE